MDSNFSHSAFAEKLGLKFPLLSDFNRQVVPQYVGFYETVGPGYKYVGRRAVFVLDKNGVVRYKWISEMEPGNTPDVNEVLQAVRSVAS